MFVSLFDLFSIGIGPSSSHTVGPMRAAKRFLERLGGNVSKTDSVVIDLYGSLAMTGRGHGTDKAVLLGLSGHKPEEVDPNAIPGILENIQSSGKILLDGKWSVPFVAARHLLFHRDKSLPFHSNGLCFTAYGADQTVLAKNIYFSVGGGFVVDDASPAISTESGHNQASIPSVSAEASIPFPFSTSEELLTWCRSQKKNIFEIVLENEKSCRTEAVVRERIFLIWSVMKGCMERGLRTEGILPGGLSIRRRAPELYRKLQTSGDVTKDPSLLMDWVSLFALAVNEENAAGGKVVTAPTNGAAGVIPAVLHYYERFVPSFSEDGLVKFFLSATAIGVLYKFGASLSAAEMGCQGEVGVACSMAAGGLAAAMGGTAAQCENAAEIGMEHNLGLTCDPVGGLVQVPCIERNTMGAIKAINAARLAMNGDGEHRVSLDDVIRAMRQTGNDMKKIYKETAEGGLALQIPVNQPEC